MSSNAHSKARAVFLDRDGVINEILFHQEMGIIETPFTVKQFQLKRGAAAAIRQIKQLGFRAVVVSNQPGVAMGHFSRKTLDKITNGMILELKKQNAILDGIYYCLHHPQRGRGKLKQHCQCRKPKAGLLYQAARDLNIDLKNSFMIGDSIFDVQAGQRAGCKTLLLAHLKCDLCHLMARKGIEPDYRVDDLRTAVRKIRASV